MGSKCLVIELLYNFAHRYFKRVSVFKEILEEEEYD